jgi:hypothetical protein
VDKKTCEAFYHFFDAGQEGFLEIAFNDFNGLSPLGVVGYYPDAYWNGGGWTLASITALGDAPKESPTPEPATLLIVGLGLAGLGLARQRK